ncbi:outer membrane beta-barrel protein [Vibrio sp. SCSIO 43136]|uniref:outer membrane beta-barrel protein n=1 Tax=Vibrio sp. SCSIO 43136 TaxID=2819101 RepID=UPI002075902C|nr:outer membrane beta-barrel protein [Vibrio sp. SCSIO 43136]USD67042.1 outer membrane beta-barrel protein [Vibrio sp. SCSIO 43136]
MPNGNYNLGAVACLNENQSFKYEVHNKMNTRHKSLLTIGTLIVSSQVHSLESTGYIMESGLEVLPLFEAGYSYDDNIGRYSNSLKADSSSLFVAKPGVVLKSDKNGNEYQVAYQLDTGRYTSSSDDNYTDHAFTTNNFIRFSRRHGLGLDYAFLKEHEARGTGVASGDAIASAINSPVKYKMHDARAVYVYGAEGAKARIEAAIDYRNLKYTNFRDGTTFGGSVVNTRFKDYTQTGLDLAFYYQMFPATKVLVQADLNDRKFELSDTSGNSQDYTDNFLYLGADWDISGKTTGKLRFGIQDKNYDSSTRKDFNGFSWDLNLEWKPTYHSIVNVTGGQNTTDADQGFTDIKQTSAKVSWKHYWLTNVYSDLSYSYLQKDYSESTREDELTNSVFNLGYEIYDRVELVAGWSHRKNDSPLSTYSYDQNIWSINANVVF